jgi:hypothetical protein
MAGTVKHASRALEKLLRDRGRSLDRRTTTGKEYFGIIDALADERGGAARLSVGEQLLIERAATLVCICRAVERYVLTTGILDGGQLVPVLVKGYATHSENLRRALLALGLRPDVVARLRDVNVIAAEHHGSDAVPESVEESHP